MPQDSAHELARARLARAVEDVARPVDSATRPSAMRATPDEGSRTSTTSRLTTSIYAVRRVEASEFLASPEVRELLEPEAATLRRTIATLTSVSQQAGAPAGRRPGARAGPRGER